MDGARVAALFRLLRALDADSGCAFVDVVWPDLSPADLVVARFAIWPGLYFVGDTVPRCLAARKVAHCPSRAPMRVILSGIIQILRALRLGTKGHALYTGSG
jgi:hypothetical protein